MSSESDGYRIGVYIGTIIVKDNRKLFIGTLAYVL